MPDNHLYSSVRSDARLFPYERWKERLPELARQYREAKPFPHIVLDDVLDEEVAERLLAAFPPPDTKTWIQWKHYNENKTGLNKRERFPPFIGQEIDEFNSPEFVFLLSTLTGISDLMADPSLEGGGMHQSGRGGFLNVHADFTMHHHHTNWRRRCNVLLYLNKDWKEEWGGSLEFWDREMKQCVQKISPLFNRMVVFNTSHESYHGHPDPMQCPEEVSRKSLALYFYTEETDPNYKAQATDYKARPQDRWRAPLIWLDNKMLRLYSVMKRRFGFSDDFVSRVLGFLSSGRKK